MTVQLGEQVGVRWAITQTHRPTAARDPAANPEAAAQLSDCRRSSSGGADY